MPPPPPSLHAARPIIAIATGAGGGALTERTAAALASIATHGLIQFDRAFGNAERPGFIGNGTAECGAAKLAGMPLPPTAPPPAPMTPFAPLLPTAKLLMNTSDLRVALPPEFNRPPPWSAHRAESSHPKSSLCRSGRQIRGPGSGRVDDGFARSLTRDRVVVRDVEVARVASSGTSRGSFEREHAAGNEDRVGVGLHGVGRHRRRSQRNVTGGVLAVL